MAASRILVVDDEPQILRALERALTSRGYDVQTASDGRAAVTAVRAAEPDLVVLDINLPHMDGLTAAREIRRTSRVPILVLSVRETEEDKVRALDLGADDYLTKPFSAGPPPGRRAAGTPPEASRSTSSGAASAAKGRTSGSPRRSGSSWRRLPRDRACSGRTHGSWTVCGVPVTKATSRCSACS